MPAAAVAYITETIVVAFGITSYAAIAAVYIAATVFVYAAGSYLLAKASQAMGPKAKGGGGQKQDLEANYYASDASIRLAYGRVKTGGMETIPAITSGPNNELLHKMLTLVGHEIDSYNNIHLDANTLAMTDFTGFTNVVSQGMVTTGVYSGKAMIRPYRGTSTDSADTLLASHFPTMFGGSRGRGISKLGVTFKFDSDLYKGIPNIGATYQGKRCYDPRLDTSPGANPTNTSYIRWTRNPTLCLIDYLMSGNGGDYPTVEIEWSLAVIAANACDAAVSVPGALTQPRYSCNGLIFTTEVFTENVKTFTNAMLGRCAYRDGKWRIYAGGWQTPTFTINKSDWISGLAIRFEQGKKKRFNMMRTWFVDPLREWQRVECNPRFNLTYQAADGNEQIPAETDQPLCTEEYEAQRKGEFLLRQSRNQIVVSGRLPPRMRDIALWDTGYIVMDQFGWSTKTFRCVGFESNPDGSVDATFAEEQSTDWIDLSAGEYNAASIAGLPAINSTQPGSSLAYEVFSTGAAKITGVAYVNTVTSLALYKDGAGSPITGGGASTLSISTYARPTNVVVTFNGFMSASVESAVGVYPYMKTSAGSVYTPADRVMYLTTTYNPVVVQAAFRLDPTQTAEVGVVYFTGVNSVLVSNEPPSTVQVEVCKL